MFVDLFLILLLEIFLDIILPPTVGLKELSNILSEKFKVNYFSAGRAAIWLKSSSSGLKGEPFWSK